MKRVVVVVNKWWECEPVLSTLLNPTATPANFPWPRLAPIVPTPAPQQPAPVAGPRAIFEFKFIAVELWCISDLLMQTTSARQSSSEDKAKFLPQIFSDAGAPDLVISVSTASSMDKVTPLNGCVYAGTKVFLHDGHPATDPNINSQWWPADTFDKVIDSALPESMFSAFFASVPPSVLAGFTPLRNIPAPAMFFTPLYGNTALATVNVTIPGDYAAADPATVAAFRAANDATAVGASVETTHGVVRTACDSPFLFISPIVNRLTMYGVETFPNAFAQNTAGSQNAGVVLSWLLTSVDTVFGGG
jgi:hypothetical protein